MLLSAIVIPQAISRGSVHHLMIVKNVIVVCFIVKICCD